MTERKGHSFTDSLTEDQQTVHDALTESAYLAGARAGWNAAQSDDPNAAWLALQKSREGHLSGLVVARERILASNLAPVSPDKAKAAQDALDAIASMARGMGQ